MNHISQGFRVHEPVLYSNVQEHTGREIFRLNLRVCAERKRGRQTVIERRPDTADIAMYFRQ